MAKGPSALLAGATDSSGRPIQPKIAPQAPRPLFGSGSPAVTSLGPVQASNPGSGSGSQLSSLISGLGGGGSVSRPGVQYNPEPFSISAEQNPQLASLIGQMGAYRGQMAAGNDQDAVLAMQRQRDLTSGMAKEFGTDSSARGISGSGAAAQDLANRVLDPAQAQMGQLNASLASDARSKQLGAMGQEANAIGSQAGITQAQQNFGLNAWQARSQAQLGAAQLQAMQNNNNSNNAMQLISLLGGLF